MWRAGNLPESSACPSAIDAYHKSTIISRDVNSAPSGAFHWWDIGSDGHVAMATDNGWAMMASCHVTESWGNCIGVTPVSTYTAATGAKYLGWSYDYDKAEIADVRRPVPPSPGVPRTATEDNGVPDTNYYKRQQIYVSSHLSDILLWIIVHNFFLFLCASRSGVSLRLHRPHRRRARHSVLGWHPARPAELRLQWPC